MNPNINTTHILGLPRSGTTILYNTLTLNDNLAYFHRESKLPLSFRKFKKNLFKPFEGSQWLKFHHELEYLDAQATNKEREYYNSEIQRFCKKFKTDTFLSKMPANVLRIKWLNSIFPNGKYIILHRDRQASIESLFAYCNKHYLRDLKGEHQYDHNFQGWITILNRFGDGTPSITAIEKYHDYMKSKQLEDSKILKNKMEVSYEEFTHDPILTIKNICDFIETDYKKINLPEISNMNYRHRTPIK